MMQTMLPLHTRTLRKTSPLGVINHSLHHLGHDMWCNNCSTLRKYDRTAGLKVQDGLQDTPYQVEQYFYVMLMIFCINFSRIVKSIFIFVQLSGGTTTTPSLFNLHGMQGDMKNKNRNRSMLPFLTI